MSIGRTVDRVTAIIPALLLLLIIYFVWRYGADWFKQILSIPENLKNMANPGGFISTQSPDQIWNYLPSGVQDFITQPDINNQLDFGNQTIYFPPTLVNPNQTSWHSDIIP